MRIAEIWRFPVKSLQGQRLESVAVDTNGIVGDRAWAIHDVESGTHLTARRQPELLFAWARLDPNPDGDRLRLTLPDGTELDGHDPTTDQALSQWLDRPVRLVQADTGSTAQFETQADETETGDWFQWEGPEGSFHDSGQARISLVSASTFRDWSRRRFRLNVVLDADGDVELIGHKVSVGGAGLTITKPIERCVMVTRPQPEYVEFPDADRSGADPAIARDLGVLKTINRDHNSCLGIGATVDRPGLLAVGDEVLVSPDH